MKTYKNVFNKILKVLLFGSYNPGNIILVRDIVIKKCFPICIFRTTLIVAWIEFILYVINDYGSTHINKRVILFKHFLHA